MAFIVCVEVEPRLRAAALQACQVTWLYSFLGMCCLEARCSRW